jgi:phosphocarrier protein HPr
MVQQQVTITNKLGLHLRAAALLVKTASSFEAEIRLRKGDMEVDAKSIMAVLGLEGALGVELLVTADGSDEEMALRTLVGLIEAKFDEGE